MIFYKKHTNLPAIPYDDAVEEALCFGWIDTTVKRLDEAKYTRRFTPRNKKSNWSVTNLRRAKKMIDQGKMTEYGLAKLDISLLESIDKAGKDHPKNPPDIPAFIQMAFKEFPIAEKYFKTLAPGYKRTYIEWITSAKMEETRIRRLEKAISFLIQSKKLPMM